MYILAFCILLAAYVFVIFLMKYMKNVKLWNAVFALGIFFLYLSYVQIIYRQVGASDWNFQNTLPVANISPFSFSITPIILLLPRKIKKYGLLLVSLLFVGMFLSTTLNCVYNTVINYKFHLHFTMDYISHFALSLWGIYIVKSGQVKLNKKDCLISSAVLLSVVTGMLIVNVIFDTAFFGLSLNGKHNIYNNVIVSNSYLSALIYYTGVIAVLFSGYFFQKKFNQPKITEEKQE